jgi:hypothetical protein
MRLTAFLLAAFLLAAGLGPARATERDGRLDVLLFDAISTKAQVLPSYVLIRDGREAGAFRRVMGPAGLLHPTDLLVPPRSFLYPSAGFAPAEGARPPAKPPARGRPPEPGQPGAKPPVAAPPAPEPRRPEAADGAVTLRAGLIEDDQGEPGLPKVRTGRVTWRAEAGDPGSPPGSAAAASAAVTLGEAPAAEPGRDLLARLFRDGERLGIAVEIPAGSALGEVEGLAMPRMRRTGAAEGEPLIGRVVRKGQGSFTVELSPDPVDRENNRDRLLGRPWLDIALRLPAGREIVLTLEAGRAGAALIRQVVGAPPG